VSRLLLTLAGVAALAAAVPLGGALGTHPPASAAGGSPLEALGRSLGGWRILAVDVLFLRGEGLRKQGRTEELPAIYQSLLELDPGNEAVADMLAGEYVDNLLPTAPTPEARFAWWREAWDVTLRALRAHPDSARLAFKASDLLLRVPDARPELAGLIDPVAGGAGGAGGEAEREARGLAFLLAAARRTEHLPKVGRLHLLRLARSAPLLAARALLRGNPPDHAALLLSAGDELLRLHPAALAEIKEEVRLEHPLPEPERVPLDRVLRAARDVMTAAIALERHEVTAPVVQARLIDYERIAGDDTALAAVVRAWLAK
jgi:hypothetical protein